MPYVIVAAAFGAALWRRARRRATTPSARLGRPGRGSRPGILPTLLGAAGLVASREIHERLRGRLFRVGTLLVLAVIAVAIGLSSLGGNTHPTVKVAVTPAAAQLVETIRHAGTTVGVRVRIVPEPGGRAADAAVRSGKVGLAVEGPARVVTDRPVRAGDTSASAQLVRAVTAQLGTARAVAAARLSPAQIAALATARPLKPHSLEQGPSSTTQGTSLLGLPLLLFLFIQYNTWTLIGVMEEKSSRVVEVLLAAVRPIQLLAGKVLGIGVVALTQAGLAVAVALGMGAATGSNVAKGTSALFLLAVLAWLLLGYAFYSWVYAAAGALAERQDQVQVIALPLSVPIVVAYVIALVAQAEGHGSTVLTVLAYLPPTAPFAMPALVSLSAVAWWGFVVSALCSLAATVLVARLAATVYRRAVLRTGRRVRLREVLTAT